MPRWRDGEARIIDTDSTSPKLGFGASIRARTPLASAAYPATLPAQLTAAGARFATLLHSHDALRTPMMYRFLLLDADSTARASPFGSAAASNFLCVFICCFGRRFDVRAAGDIDYTFFEYRNESAQSARWI